MDKGSLLGLFVALGGILAGLTVEGGNVGQILQPTAAMIVLGGTLGAVMVQYPLPVVLAAFARLRAVFFCPEPNYAATIAELVQLAQKARKQGIVALDADLPGIQSPFLRKAITLAVDGAQAAELRKVMEDELTCEAERRGEMAAVFESAGGFSPTIGIIGAVLGLIQVMQHLDKIDEVGRGIAVAFVATIYGVASANLFFLPAGGKLRMRFRQEEQQHELMLEAVTCMVEGMNPRLLQSRLEGLAGLPPAPEPGAAVPLGAAEAESKQLESVS